MANKVITVTDPSIVTNDTLAGYNNYSDQDGQLGTTMTPTEATNGKTITLSDGVVHEVTTKPVGTTNGEFSAVVSNAVTVNLATGIIFEDDFAGTTIDATNWAVTNPSSASGLAITQNNALLFTASELTTSGNDDVQGQGSNITSGNAVMVFDLTVTDQNGSFWLVAIRGIAGNSLQIQRGTANGYINVDINTNSIGRVDEDVLMDVGTTKTFKISYLAGVSTISYWDVSSWTSIGTSSEAMSDSTTLRPFLVSAGAASDTQVMTIDNYFLTSEDFLTQYPI